jgi:predicted lipid-binding transport protein (Tim44 family)
VSIAQHIATSTPASRTRRPPAPLHPVPNARPGLALAQIVGLMAVTAMGAAFVVGAVAIAIMMVASNLGG